MPSTYAEKIEINVSGEADAAITIKGITDLDGNYPTITQDESVKEALLTIHNQSHMRLENINFKVNQRGQTPMGIQWY